MFTTVLTSDRANFDTAALNLSAQLLDQRLLPSYTRNIDPR